MSVLRNLRKLVFGETWVLPVGVVAVVVLGAVLHVHAPGVWRVAGPVLLPAAALGLLAAGVWRTLPGRRP